jgi:hypothetical protein
MLNSIDVRKIGVVLMIPVEGRLVVMEGNICVSVPYIGVDVVSVIEVYIGTV